MIQTVQGVIHGKTIELVVDPGFQPGQTIEVQLTGATASPRVWGDGIRASAGIAADIPGAEEAWQETERLRKSDGYRDVPEHPQ